MLMRTDPFRELDRLTQTLLGTGPWSQPAIMPMDAYRHDGQFIVHFDLPGVDPSSIDVNIERNVLTVRAERKPEYGEDVELQANERPRGVFTRQLFLGDTLETDHIQASYDAGVLILRIPIAEAAKPRKIEITAGGAPKVIEAA